MAPALSEEDTGGQPFRAKGSKMGLPRGRGGVVGYPLLTQSVSDMAKKTSDEREANGEMLTETEQFLARLRDGDADAFERLVARWYPQLYQTALSYCRHPDDATEVVQETFLAAYLKMHSFGGRSSIGSWLTRITVNMSLMKLRDRRRRNKIELAYHQEKLCHPSARESPLQRTGSLAELRRALEDAIFALPPDYGVVFILRECRSYSTATVARALEISAETVKSRLHQARGLLRKALSRHFEDQHDDSEPLYGPTWWKRAA